MNAHRKSMVIAVVAAVMLLVGAVGVSAASATKTFTGDIASGAQYDLYVLPLAAGNIITATVYCDPISPTLDTVLSVYFPGGDASDTANANVYNDDGGSQSCGGFHNSTLTFSVPANGNYTFRVDGFGSATGAYRLEIVVDPGGNPMLSDGRINGQQDAPVILYCDGTTVIGTTTSGQPLFQLATGETGSGAGWSMGTAPDGRMLLTSTFADGKAYNFAFGGCPHGKYDVFSGDPPMLYDSGSY